MQEVASQFPDLERLAIGLTSVFAGGSDNRNVTIVSREPAIYASTFPSEIVTCRLTDGRQLTLFCKYTAGRSHTAYGHRGDVAYEAEVYRQVLQPLQVSVPRFYGAHTDMETGETWLIVEHIDNSTRVTRTPAQGAVGMAARWIGRFHAANEARISNASMAFLKMYDSEYYIGWARRTCHFAAHLHQRFPWLTTLCDGFEEIVAPLLSKPPTVIHGEYYPANILFRDGVIYPIDWESAALAVGEIDLASLTERWPKEVAREFELQYCRARWAGGPPADFERCLDLARLYLHFRWLGDRREWTVDVSLQPQFEQLRSTGERLGLV